MQRRRENSINTTKTNIHMKTISAASLEAGIIPSCRDVRDMGG